MNLWIASVMVGVGTYLTRASFILALADRDLPPIVQRAMRSVGPAVLAALVAALVVGDSGIIGLWKPVELASLAAAAGVALRFHNLPAALAAGMGTLWLLRWLTG